MNLKKKLPYQKILCLDFDGVLHSYGSGWKGARNIPDPPVPGMVEFLVDATAVFKVAVLSSRSHAWGGRRAMRRWLRLHAREYFRSAAVSRQAGWPRSCQTPASRMLWDIGAQTMEPMEVLEREAADKLVSRISFPKHKPPAHVSIDDRAINFSGEWPQIAWLDRYRPWMRGGVLPRAYPVHELPDEPGEAKS